MSMILSHCPICGDSYKLCTCTQAQKDAYDNNYYNNARRESENEIAIKAMDEQIVEALIRINEQNVRKQKEQIKGIMKTNPTIEWQKLEPKERTFCFATCWVCPKCGNAVDSKKYCTKQCGAVEPMTVKEYYEKVLKKEFKESDWSFVVEEINAISGVDLNSELVK